MAGAALPPPEPVTFNGMALTATPRVVLTPSFAPTLADVKVRGRVGTGQPGGPAYVPYALIGQQWVHHLKPPSASHHAAGSATFLSLNPPSYHSP